MHELPQDGQTLGKRLPKAVLGRGQRNHLRFSKPYMNRHVAHIT